MPFPRAPSSERWRPAWRASPGAYPHGSGATRRRAARHPCETLVADLDTGTVEAVLDDRNRVSLQADSRQFTPEELTW